MHERKGSRHYIIGKGSGAPLYIFQRGDSYSDTSWLASIKVKGGERTYRNIPNCPNREYAIKEARRIFDTLINNHEHVLDGLYSILNATTLLGTWKLTGKPLEDFLRRNNKEGAYIYALFPSDGTHDIRILNDVFQYVRYGKFGSTGMGKDARASLKHRLLSYYRCHLRAPKYNKWNPTWMDDVLMPIQEWYVSVLNLNPKKTELQKSAALTMEQICIYNAINIHGVSPYGNINESSKRTWTGPVSVKKITTTTDDDDTDDEEQKSVELALCQ